MTEWAILFERDVLFISSVVTRLTCPGRGEVHQWSPCHNARRKLGLTGGARANPVCDHPGLATISNFSHHFFLASEELSVSLNQPKYVTLLKFPCYSGQLLLFSKATNSGAQWFKKTN